MTGPTPILYTIPNFVTAGSGRALLNIVARLDRERFAPGICVQRRGGSLEAEVEKLGVPLIEARFTIAPRPLATLPARARAAAKPFRGRGFVLWHSFHYLDDYTEPLVARFAGARSWVYTKKNMSWNHRSWWIRTLAASRVAAQNTDMLRDFFSPALFRRKTVLIPRGVDTERFRPGQPARLGLRARLGTPPDAAVVGCVANLVPVKGHGTLIEALAGVPGAHLWLAGRELDAGYAADLRRRAAAAGVSERVAFVGEIGDVPAFLAELDAFVLPTPAGEGSPVALLEAMSSGLACVAADAAGSRDLVEAGTSGRLVPAGDSSALAAALVSLLADARERQILGAGARRRVLERFSIEREVADHQALYDDILSARNARRAA